MKKPRLVGLVAVARPVDREACLAQTGFDSAADQVVVFYEEYTHGASIPLEVFSPAARIVRAFCKAPAACAKRLQAQMREQTREQAPPPRSLTMLFRSCFIPRLCLRFPSA